MKHSKDDFDLNDSFLEDPLPDDDDFPLWEDPLTDDLDLNEPFWEEPLLDDFLKGFFSGFNLPPESEDDLPFLLFCFSFCTLIFLTACITHYKLTPGTY